MGLRYLIAFFFLSAVKFWFLTLKSFQIREYNVFVVTNLDAFRVFTAFLRVFCSDRCLFFFLYATGARLCIPLLCLVAGKM